MKAADLGVLATPVELEDRAGLARELHVHLAPRCVVLLRVPTANKGANAVLAACAGPCPEYLEHEVRGALLVLRTVTIGLEPAES